MERDGARWRRGEGALDREQGATRPGVPIKHPARIRRRCRLSLQISNRVIALWISCCSHIQSYQQMVLWVKFALN